VFYISVCELSLLTIGVVDVADMDLPKGVSVLYIAEDGKGKRLNLQTGETEDVSAKDARECRTSRSNLYSLQLNLTIVKMDKISKGEGEIFLIWTKKYE
jgi:hypothetical protein